MKYAAMVVFVLSFILPCTTATADDLFPDDNLEKVVRHYVFEKRDNDEPLTEKDVEKISTIEAKGKGIKDLTGLEKCRSLSSLDLEDNEVVDLSPIKDLKDIQLLNVANNKIEDLTPIAQLTGLQYAHLSGNQIKDLKSLAKRAGCACATAYAIRRSRPAARRASATCPA